MDFLTSHLVWGFISCLNISFGSPVHTERSNKAAFKRIVVVLL